MKKRTLYIIGVVIFLAGIILGGLLATTILVPEEKTAVETHRHEGEVQLYTCPMHPDVITEEPGTCPRCGMQLVPVKVQTGKETAAKPKGERKILYWQAPMDPTEIYDHPGKSKMGMDLIPVYEDEATLGRGGMITIDPTTTQNMGVRTDVVKREPFSHRIRTVGRLTYDEEKLYTISPKISGWIEKLYVDFTGQLVQEGRPLLEIYSPELVTTQEEYLLALKTKRMVSQSRFASVKKGGESLLEAARKRLLYWDIPVKEIERLEQVGEIKKTVSLVSPVTGVVIHKNAVEGMFTKEGQNLYRIADLSTVWVLVSVYDNEIPWVKVGQEAEMELSYLPGKTYRGRVIYIYPYLNKKARDVQIRLEFPNPNFELKPEMYATVYLKSDPIPNALTIPSEAVIRSGERNIVFVEWEPGKFEPREIQIGVEGENGKVQVLSGLLEGEKIVTSAQFLLDSESRLQEAIQKMLAEKRAQKQGE